MCVYCLGFLRFYLNSKGVLFAGTLWGGVFGGRVDGREGMVQEGGWLSEWHHHKSQLTYDA